MIINDDVSFGFAISNLLDDLSWLSHDNGECMMLLVVFVDKGGCEVATVLQHLKLPGVAPLLAVVHADNGVAAVKANCKTTDRLSSVRPEGNGRDVDANEGKVAFDGDVDTRQCRVAGIEVLGGVFLGEFLGIGRFAKLKSFPVCTDAFEHTEG